MQHRLLFLFMGILLSLSAFSQRNGNNPYSIFGLGENVSQSFMHLRSMGSIGNSYLDPYHINIINPASYSYLNATSFDVGVSSDRRRLIKGNIQSDPIWSGNLDYIALAFPLNNPLNELLERKRKDYSLGMSFALTPVTRVNYNIAQQDSTAELGDFTRSNIGTGGANRFLWGNSIRYKEFSFGINLGYVFGNIRKENNLFFLEQQAVYQNEFATDYNVSGFSFDAGLTYTRVLNQKDVDEKKTREKKQIVLGVTVKTGSSLTTNATVSNFGVQDFGTAGLFRDTISFQRNLEGETSLPAQIGFGASYYNGSSFVIGVDFSQTSWSNYFNTVENDAKNTLKDSYSVSLGGYFRPNYRSFTSYFKRVYYRYGLYYRTDPREIDGNQINNYGFTVGLGMPFVYQRKISHVNLGFELGRQGGGTPIEESYAKFTLGFTFNDDEWFLKRKYN